MHKMSGIMQLNCYQFYAIEFQDSQNLSLGYFITLKEQSLTSLIVIL